MPAAPVRHQPRRSRPAIVAALLLVLMPLLALTSGGSASAADPALTGLHVVGNQLLNGANQPLRLLGVNRSGSEYACIQGWGFFDGPTDQAAIDAIKRWRANAVRVPLNEGCWLAINGAPPPTPAPPITAPSAASSTA